MIDFQLEKMEFDKTVELAAHGWKPLKIEYVIKVISSVSWVFWRIAETEHVFRIQYQIILTRHGNDLKDHFSLVLETFRNDYKTWEKENFPEEWMKKYQKMYHDLIK
jgi:hypothetical protein